MRRFNRSPAAVVALFAFGFAPLAFGFASPASADLIRLQNGGEVRGKLRPGHTRDAEVTMETLTGGLIVVPRQQIAFTTVRSVDVEEYETRLKRLTPSVEGHWELAEWCREKRLRPQRTEQLEAILLLDPAHVEAHQALGHVQEHGEWMTREEQMARRGYVRHQGRWVSQQELELLEKNDAERAAEREWFTKVHGWVRWVAGVYDRQRAQGRAALLEITDPAAVAALTQNMAEHDDVAVRQLFVEVLKGLGGPRPVRPLVERSLFDQSVQVREAARAALKPDQYAAAVGVYVQALLNNDNQVVNRAGEALGEIGDPRIVPALIDALVTTHRYEIKTPVNQGPNIGLVQGGNFIDPQALSQYLPPDVEIGLRTGQYPFGAIVLPPAGIPQAQKFRIVKVQAQVPNPQVLAALVKLTKQDFGYDKRTWKLWWAAEGHTVLSAA